MIATPRTNFIAPAAPVKPRPMGSIGLSVLPWDSEPTTQSMTAMTSTAATNWTRGQVAWAQNLRRNFA